MLGLGVLILFDQPIAYPTALALMGLSNGMGSTINNAMLAEIYGTAVIGQIRSLFITVMVGSTALGPIIFGVLLDYDTSYSVIFLGCCGFIACCFERIEELVAGLSGRLMDYSCILSPWRIEPARPIHSKCAK